MDLLALIDSSSDDENYVEIVDILMRRQTELSTKMQ